MTADDIDSITPLPWYPQPTSPGSPWAALRYARAFPKSLADTAAKVFLNLPIGMTPSGNETAVVRGEALAIPSRIYNPPVPVSASTSDQIEQSILYCIYTRHHDGRVRQRAVEHLIDSPEPWVVPFVVRLVGEYVVEIVESICHRLDLSNPVRRAQYGSIVAENPALFDLTRQRAISYWNCYYRYEYPVMRPSPGSGFATYPAFRLIDELRTAATGSA